MKTTKNNLMRSREKRLLIKEHTGSRVQSREVNLPKETIKLSLMNMRKSMKRHIKRKKKMRRRSRKLKNKTTRMRKMALLHHITLPLPNRGKNPHNRANGLLK